MAAFFFSNIGKLIPVDRMFQTAFKTIKSHSGSLTNSLSIIIVAVSEVLIGINVFQCPCETDNLNALFKPHDPKLVASQERKYYAIAFIVWPTVAAFFMCRYTMF